VPRAFRPLLVAYPLAMAFSLVYLGEHYVADLAAGAALVAAVSYAEPRLLTALQARLARRSVVAGTAIEPA
jgi:membrane-associated phospholipid phosphatase